MAKTLALVEDSLEVLQGIREFVQTHYPGLRLVGEARSEDEAYALLARQRPDIALLDIGIIGGTSFNVLARLDADGLPLPQVIFLSGLNTFENARKTLDYFALDFIPKPFEPDALRAALDKTIARLDTQETLLDDVLAAVEHQRREGRIDRIVVQLLKGVRRLVPLSEIMYFHADREITRVHLNGVKIQLDAMVNIGHYKQLLQDDTDFLLIHQSYLVNADYIHHFDPRDGGEVVLINQVRLRTSQTGNRIVRDYFQRQQERRPMKIGLLDRLRRWLRG